MTKRIGLMLAALAVLLGFGGAAVNTLSAQEQGVAGLWVGSITADDGGIGIVNVTIKQRGDAISGTLSNTLADLVDSPIVGVLKGNKLSFSVPKTGARWEGTVDGDLIKGTALKGKRTERFVFTRLKQGPK